MCRLQGTGWALARTPCAPRALGVARSHTGVKVTLPGSGGQHPLQGCVQQPSNSRAAPLPCVHLQGHRVPGMVTLGVPQLSAHAGSLTGLPRPPLGPRARQTGRPVGGGLVALCSRWYPQPAQWALGWERVGREGAQDPEVGGGWQRDPLSCGQRCWRVSAWQSGGPASGRCGAGCHRGLVSPPSAGTLKAVIAAGITPDAGPVAPQQ